MTMLDKSYDHRICTVHNPLYTAAEISVFCLIIFSPKLASDKFMKLLQITAQQAYWHKNWKRSHART